MPTKPRYLLNIPDLKDKDNKWIISYNPEANLQLRTRAGCLWSNVNNRCLLGGSYQQRHPTYKGTTNDFIDFQEFAEWCQGEYGYWKKDRDKFWSLDKDILIPNSKSYSPGTCMFVPRKVNSLLVSSKDRKGECPLGVCFVKKTSNYRAAGKGKNDSTIHLGSFSDGLSAHKAWQQFKVDRIHDFCENDPEVAEHEKLVVALKSIASKIEYDMFYNRETKWEEI